MICFRIVVVLLLALFTACMTCSCLFPLFRLVNDTALPNAVVTATYYYFYAQNTTQNPDKTWTTHRLYMHDGDCDKMQDIFGSASWLAVAAAGLGGLATLLGAAWIFVGRSIFLGVTNFMLALLAFLCAAAVVALMAVAYRLPLCFVTATGTIPTAPFTAGYAIAEGFVMVVVAAGGFLVVMITEAIGFCCGCQVGRRPAQQPCKDVPREPIDDRSQEVTEMAKEKDDEERTITVDEAEASVDAPTQVKPMRAHTAEASDSADGAYPYPRKGM